MANHTLNLVSQKSKLFRGVLGLFKKKILKLCEMFLAETYQIKLDVTLGKSASFFRSAESILKQVEKDEDQ